MGGNVRVTGRLLKLGLGWGLVALVAARAAVPEGLQRALSEALNAGKGAGVSWGAFAVTAGGTVVFSTNAVRSFIPASNTKLFTTALALDRLGPEQVLRTPVLAAAAPDAEGVVRSDLWIVGQGDPDLGADPDKMEFVDPLQPLAERLHAAGVRQVAGDLVLSEERFRTARVGKGWDPEDFLEWYGAPVSAFVVDDNTFRVVATPAETAGLPALFRVEPDLPSLRVDWKVTTSTNRNHSVAYSREPGSNGMRFTGRIPLGSKPWTPELAVADPVVHFGEALREAMHRRGIEFNGAIRTPRAGETNPATVVAEWVSEPLSARIRRCNKPSQNLHAQLLLAQVGAALERDGGSTNAIEDLAVSGLRALPALLRRAGVPETAVHLDEGSGLSRGNRVTPAATTLLLRLMASHPSRGAWMASLPVGGVDGTLRNRFRKGPATGNVRAKTGGLRGVAALAGYVTTAAGEEITFAVYANDAAGDPEVRNRIDRWVELLAAQPARF